MSYKLFTCPECTKKLNSGDGIEVFISTGKDRVMCYALYFEGKRSKPKNLEERRILNDS